ncbi:MAG TPA: hypothetical protein VKA48_03245 [Gammaproteobacteria bacterium]|nr:hypothetical protein [Gammaproteobacteria bacterium]
MAPPAPKQPKLFCQFPLQLLIEAVLLTVAAYVPFAFALILAIAAITFPMYCFSKAEAPEQNA